MYVCMYVCMHACVCLSACVCPAVLSFSSVYESTTSGQSNELRIPRVRTLGFILSVLLSFK